VILWSPPASSTASHEVAAAELTEGYDRVILATGSTPPRHGWTALQPARWAPDAPALPGADQWNVYAPEDVLGGPLVCPPLTILGTGIGLELPHRVLVLDDTGDRQALVVADYLAEKRHPAQVVTAYPQIAHQTAGSFDLGFVYGSLRRRGVTFTTHSLVTEIDGDEVILTDVHTRETTRLENVDAVVLSLGNAANDGLSNELAALGVATTSIGDCQSPRRIFNAIWEGEHAGLAVWPPRPPSTAHRPARQHAELQPTG
jgi:Pyridine nucleotide-disulphide oxidoreductase